MWQCYTACVKISTFLSCSIIAKGLDYFPIENEAHFTVGQIESSSVRVLITEDNAWEGMEMFRVSFDIPEGVDAEKGLPNSMQVGIRDDDSKYSIDYVRMYTCTYTCV